MGEAKRRGSRVERQSKAIDHHDKWEGDYQNGAGSNYPPNELIFRHHIERINPKAINPNWVYWMLAMLWNAKEKGLPIRKEYIAKIQEKLVEPPMELPE